MNNSSIPVFSLKILLSKEVTFPDEVKLSFFIVMYGVIAEVIETNFLGGSADMYYTVFPFPRFDQ